MKIKKLNKFAAIIFFITSAMNVNSQTIDDKIQKGINFIYNIQFDSAEITFKEVIETNKSNPAGYFFIAMVDWWRININRENDSLDEKFLKEVDKAVEVADDILDKNENDDNAMFYKGGALGYRGLLQSLRESWLKAAEDGREALNLLQKAYEVNKNNKDVLFGVGLYNYFAEYIPETYPVVKPLMLIFPKGDKLKGLAQIKETSLEAKYAKTEARYVLAYLNNVYEKNYSESESYAKSLHQEFPGNPIFEKYLYNSYIGLGKWNEALQGWLGVLNKIDSSQTGYTSRSINREANYYTALCLTRMGRILEAEKYILKAEEITKEMDKENEHSFTAFIYLINGMLNDAKGNRSTAEFYYDKVLAMKNFQDSHEQAKKLKSEGYKQ